MKKISLFAAALAMMSMAAVSCSSSQTTESTEDSAVENETVEQADASDAVVTDGVVQLADDNMFTPDTKVAVPTVLDFNAVWCVPCKKLTPAFDKAAETYAGKVSFYSVDIDKNPKTAAAFNIQNVPTVIFMSPDGSVKTFVGLDPFGVKPTTSPEELTQTIIDGMNKKVEELLNK